MSEIPLHTIELEKIKELQQLTHNVTLEYGNIELSKKALQARTERVDLAFKQLREQEQQLIKELELKYGQGSIDIPKGVFIPSTSFNTPVSEKGST